MSSTADLLDLLRQAREDLGDVTNQSVIGDLEDRRFGILVDGDDGLGAAHACEVLHGAADADGKVELRRDGFPGLSDLLTVRAPAGVDDGARRSERAVA